MFGVNRFGGIGQFDAHFAHFGCAANLQVVGNTGNIEIESAGNIGYVPRFNGKPFAVNPVFVQGGFFVKN